VQELFKQYYRPTDAAFRYLWEQAWIVFDTSALLGCYRDSSHIVDEALKVVETLQDRLWLPHQVALEYHNNRANVESDLLKAQSNIRKETERAINDILAACAANRHPFLADEVSKRVEQFSKAAFKLLRNADASDAERLRERMQSVQQKLESAFSNIGKPFSATELDAICLEGKVRYEKRIPPGFLDNPKDASEKAKYGDFVLWKQMITQSKTTERPVLLVTNDRKEDWWWLGRGGKMLGPLPQLRVEFEQESTQQYYSYTMEGFVKYAVPRFLNRRPSKRAEEDAATSERAEQALLEKHSEIAAIAWNSLAPTAAGRLNATLAEALRGWQPASVSPQAVAALDAISRSQMNAELEKAARALAQTTITPELLKVIVNLAERSKYASEAIKRHLSPTDENEA
jgi:hypothetical protein